MFSSGSKRKLLKPRQPSIEVTATSANAYLKVKKFEKSEQGGSSSCNYIYSAAAVQGFRSKMQDEFVCKPDTNFKNKLYGYFGVFDAHGDDGEIVSQFCADNVLKLLLSRRAIRQARVLTNELLAAGVHKTMIKLDQQFRLSETDDGTLQFKYGGSTACFVLISADDIMFVNVGDSRAFLCRDGGVVFETKDHNPSDEDEEKRITEGGGRVHTTPSRHKVILDPAGYNNLAVSRTIGDFSFKPDSKLLPEALPVTATPDIDVVTRNRSSDQFLLVASDGIFKSMTSLQVVDFVLRQLRMTDDLTKICRDLIDTAYFAYDNIPDDTTVILIVFPSAPTVSQQIIAEETEIEVEALQAIEDEIKDIAAKAEGAWVLENTFSILQRLVKNLPEKYRVQLRTEYVFQTLSRYHQMISSKSEENGKAASSGGGGDSKTKVLNGDQPVPLPEAQEDDKKTSPAQNEPSDTSADDVGVQNGGNKSKENTVEGTTVAEEKQSSNLQTKPSVSHNTTEILNDNRLEENQELSADIRVSKSGKEKLGKDDSLQEEGPEKSPLETGSCVNKQTEPHSDKISETGTGDGVPACD